MTRHATASEEKSSRSYWGFVLWPVAVIVFYVLSLGPALLAADKRAINRERLHVYSPLVPILRTRALGKPFGMYLHLWVPEDFDKGGTYIGEVPQK